MDIYRLRYPESGKKGKSYGEIGRIYARDKCVIRRICLRISKNLASKTVDNIP